MPVLERFNEEMSEIYSRARAVGVHFGRINMMIQNQTAFETARLLVNETVLSNGFLKLIEVNRLDLSIEHLILRDPYNQLFDEETKANARRKLRENGNFDF